MLSCLRLLSESFPFWERFRSGFVGGLDGVVEKRFLPVHIYGPVRAFLIYSPNKKGLFLAVDFNFEMPQDSVLISTTFTSFFKAVDIVSLLEQYTLQSFSIVLKLCLISNWSHIKGVRCHLNNPKIISNYI